MTIAVLEVMARALGVPVAAHLIEPSPDAPRPKPLRAGRRARRVIEF